MVSALNFVPPFSWMARGFHEKISPACAVPKEASVAATASVASRLCRYIRMFSPGWPPSDTGRPRSKSPGRALHRSDLRNGLIELSLIDFANAQGKHPRGQDTSLAAR